MDEQTEIQQLRAQLRLTGMMLGQIWGMFRCLNVIDENACETFFANFSTDNGINTEFMDNFRIGLDRMTAPLRAEQDLPPHGHHPE